MSYTGQHGLIQAFVSVLSTRHPRTRISTYTNKECVVINVGVSAAYLVDRATGLVYEPGPRVVKKLQKGSYMGTLAGMIEELG